jgi:hypothetical protein
MKWLLLSMLLLFVASSYATDDDPDEETNAPIELIQGDNSNGTPKPEEPKADVSLDTAYLYAFVAGLLTIVVFILIRKRIKK